MKKITHGSIFSGIGGFDLAANWCGLDNIFQVEIDKFCQKVLAKNFPSTKRYEDIKEFDGTKYRGTIDVLSGGIPCQPASVAGKRKGKADDRWLWEEAIRVCREIKPTFILFENVPGLLSLENGEAFEGILTSLEAEGYTTESFIIPACSIGAWHRRDRIWILGYSDRIRRQNKHRAIQKKNETREVIREGRIINASKNGNVTNSNSNGNEDKLDTRTNQETSTGSKIKDQQQTGRSKNGKRIRIKSEPSCKTITNTNSTQRGSNKRESDTETNRRDNVGGICQDVPNSTKQRLQRGKQTNGCNRKWNESWKQWQIESNMGGMVARLSPELDGYWDKEPGNVPRVATGVKNRVNRLKGLGNAVCPQIPYIFFRIISQILNYETRTSIENRRKSKGTPFSTL